jgi:hypothetical protein
MNSDSMLRESEADDTQRNIEPEGPTVGSFIQLLSSQPLESRNPSLASTTHHSTILPAKSTTNENPRDPASLFTRPYTTIARSQTAPSTVELFVPSSTLLQIPFFLQKVVTGDLRRDIPFHMLEEGDNACSLVLLFAFVQDQTVLSLIDPEGNLGVGSNEERASSYIRAYPLAH